MTVATCQKCSTALAPKARFCSSCGAEVARTMTNPAQFISVLACQLSIPDTMPAPLGQQHLARMTERFAAICEAAVSAQNGRIAHLEGGRVEAWFGHPEKLRNSAANAVHAALDIVNAPSLSGGPDPVTVQAGVSTGWMQPDPTDAPTARDMQNGPGPEQVAAQIVSQGRPGRVVVSSDTSARLDSASFAIQPLGRHDIPGFQTRMDLWQVKLSDQSLQPTFIGRADRLEQLTEAWRRACTGKVTSVDICGPGGIGKSELVSHFISTVADEGHVFALQAEQHRHKQSFHPFRLFVRTLSGCNANTSIEGQQARLESWAYPQALRGLKLLFDFDSDPMAALSRAAVITNALQDVIDSILPDDPAILVVEDVHWLDADSAELLAALPGLLAGRPLLILMTRRPEGDPIFADPDATLDMERFGLGEALEFVASIDQGKRITLEMRHLIVSQAAGLPLHIGHITRAVLEWSEPDATLDVPETMIEALLERYAQLDGSRDVVEAAAVLGPEIRIDVLAAMLGFGASEVSARLTSLIGGGLFRPGANGVVRFDHALSLDAVQSNLLRERRVALNEAAITAYSRVAPHLVAAEPAIEARHLMSAERPLEGIPKLLEAARLALLRGQIAEALRLLGWCDRGLSDIDNSHVLHPRLSMMVDFTTGLALVQARGFSDALVAERLQRALDLCLAAEDSGLVEFQIGWGIWAHYVVIGDVERADAMIHRLDQIAEEEPDLQVLAAAARSVQAGNSGDFLHQEAAVSQARSLYQFELNQFDSVTYSMDSLELALLFQCHGRWICGDLEGWTHSTQGALMHFERLQQPALGPYVHVYSNASACYVPMDPSLKGKLEAAIGTAVELGQPFWIVSGGIWLAHLAARGQGYKESLDQFRAAIEPMYDIGLNMGFSLYEATFARCLAEAGWAAEAQHRLDRSLDRIRAGRDRLYAAEVLRQAAEIALLLDPGAESETQAYLKEAEEIARSQGAQAWLALCLGSQARLNARKVGRAAAQTWLNAELEALHPDITSSHPAVMAAANVFTRAI